MKSTMRNRSDSTSPEINLLEVDSLGSTSSIYAGVERKLPRVSCSASSRRTSSRTTSSDVFPRTKSARCDGVHSNAASYSSLTRSHLSGEIPIGVPQLGVQPRFCDRPIALHRFRRNTQKLRSFFNGQPSEVPQFDNPALPGIQFREPFQGVIQFDQLFGMLRGE